MKYISVSELQTGDVFMEDTFPEVYEVTGQCPNNPGAILASDIRSKEKLVFHGNVPLVLLSRSNPQRVL